MSHHCYDHNNTNSSINDLNVVVVIISIKIISMISMLTIIIIDIVLIFVIVIAGIIGMLVTIIICIIGRYNYSPATHYTEPGHPLPSSFHVDLRVSALSGFCAAAFSGVLRSWGFRRSYAKAM